MATDARATLPSGASVKAACAHCGLPVPRGLIDPATAQQFCCAGCRTAFEVVNACGLAAYYRLRESSGIDAEPAASRGGDYQAFDDAKFAELYVTSLPDGLAAVEFCLEGVHCAACVWLVERLGRVVDGIVESRLDFGRRIVRIVWNPARTRLSAVARALDRLGYAPHPASGVAARASRRAEDRRHLARIGIAAALAGNVMLMSFALYAGWLNGMELQYELLMRWGSVLLGVIAVAWPGAVFLRGAWAALRTRTPHLDLPIAFALVVGAVAGVASAIAGSSAVYFDSLSLLVFLLLVGRFIQHRQQRAAADAVELLLSLTPRTARRVDRDGEAEVLREAPVEAIESGEVVEVRAGESIPVDGVVVRGSSRVDASLLSGESRPVAVAAGDGVHAGTVNVSATLRVRVEATGKSTRAGRLMAMVERAAVEKPPSVQLADRLSGWFVATVGIAAIATLAGWWPFAGAWRATEHAVALLIVACPCALGLATPLTLAVAMGRAARRGILIKGGAALERLARPGVMLLDKTGTLTRGRLTLVDWTGDDAVKRAAAGLERQSGHPLARALVESAIVSGETEDDLPEAQDVEQLSGAGITGVVDGVRVVVGSPELVGARAGVPEWAMEHVERLASDELTPVLVAVGDRVAGVAGFGDAPRADAASAIASLRAQDWDLSVLSGDDARVVRRVGTQLGLDEKRLHGGVGPERKVEILRATMERRSPTVMVGDGVNDAAALAAADVGVAVHGGAEASLAAADVYLRRAGLRPVVDLITGARRTARAIRRNLAVSLVYNVTGVSLAAAGLVHPLVAAVLMPISSLTVVGMSIGARTFGAEK